jgi:hypothetical protein
MTIALRRLTGYADLGVGFEPFLVSSEPFEIPILQAQRKGNISKMQVCHAKTSYLPKAVTIS